MRYLQSSGIIILLVVLMLYLDSCSNDDVILPNVKAIQKIDPDPDPEGTVTIVPLEELRNELIVDVLNFNTLKEGKQIATEGFIISSDNDRNIQNALYVQDKASDPLLGVRILIDRDNINTSNFGINRKISLRLNGLGMQYNEDVLEIGKLRNNIIVPLDSGDFTTFITSTNEAENIVPLSRTIKEIQEAIASTTLENKKTGILVRIDDLQLVDSDLGKTYANSASTGDVIRTLRSCVDGKFISMINSGNALFKDQTIPQKRLRITAILEGNSLRIRSNSDIEELSGDLCRQDVSSLIANVTLDKVVAAYQGNSVKLDSTIFGLDEETAPITEGYVIRVDKKKDRIVVQDAASNPTVGLVLDILSPEPIDYPIGQKVVIQLDGLGLNADENRILQLSNVNSNFELESINNDKGFVQTVVPLPDSIASLVAKQVVIADIVGQIVPQSIYVELDNIQLSTDSVLDQPFLGENEFFPLYNCDSSTKILIQKGYSNANLPENILTNRGTINGITSFRNTSPPDETAGAFLILNDRDEANFNDPQCDEIEVLFQENFTNVTIAQPINNNTSWTSFTDTGETPFWTIVDQMGNSRASFMSTSLSRDLISPQIPVTSGTLTVTFDYYKIDMDAGGLDVKISPIRTTVPTLLPVEDITMQIQNSTMTGTSITATFMMPDTYEDFAIKFDGGFDGNLNSFQIDNIVLARKK